MYLLLFLGSYIYLTCSNVADKMLRHPHSHKKLYLNLFMLNLSGSIFVSLSSRHTPHSGKLLIEITLSSVLWCFRTLRCPAGHLCLLHTKASSSAPLCWEIIFQQVSLSIQSHRHIASCVKQRVEQRFKNKTHDVQRLLVLYGALHYINCTISFNE